ncbi:alpha/beta fold hydrolase [Desertimonas flava]|uniref:alpha/beta fold hydrolase n=1 Tax=Desertimonas flava TaxID=2064846 RepID=UPI000E34BE84|nr:alpha/beta hydrolase [Desertimonas flava]
MRARAPDASGFVRRGDVEVWWERFGIGDPALLFMGADTIVHSHMWKAQLPWFSRRNLVVAFDPVGNGRSSRSLDPAAYAESEVLAFALAVLDAAGVGQAVAIGVCTGAGLSLQLAAGRPDRVCGVVAINPGMLLAPMQEHHGWSTFDDVLADEDGWHKENRHSWARDWPGYARFFFDQMLPEPHSTKQHEDAVAWACSTTADVMLAGEECGAPTRRAPEEAAVELCRQVRCPVLVINGDRDMCQDPERSRRVAELTGGDLVVFEGSGHLPHARDPVRVNLEIDGFLRRLASRTNGLSSSW